MMTYEQIGKALDDFIQEFKKDIKNNHDLILNHINDSMTAHTPASTIIKDSNYEDRYNTLKMSEATENLLKVLMMLSDEHYVHPVTHSADMIDTNPGRRFITDVQVESFANKLDKAYLDKRLEEFTAEQRRTIDNKLGNIINMRKVTDNLQSINALLDSDATLSKLIELCTDKVDQEDLSKHIKNDIQHISEDDRNYLIMLAKFINAGGCDWNASSDELNHIKNKPTKLPADGGNCDTVKGRSVDKLLSGRKTSTIVIGKSLYGFTTDDVDYLCTGRDDTETIQKAINDLLSREVGGELYFREGTYNIHGNLYIKPSKAEQNIIITGCGNASILDFNHDTNHNLIIGNNVEVTRLSFNKCTIRLGSNSEINNSKITYSKLIFDNANISALSNSDINFSELALEGSCINNMISNNRFIKTTMPIFNGDNYINNNFKFN